MGTGFVEAAQKATPDKRMADILLPIFRVAMTAILNSHDYIFLQNSDYDKKYIKNTRTRSLCQRV